MLTSYQKTMKLPQIVFCAVFIQIATAQVFGPRNAVSDQVSNNQPTQTQHIANNANTIRTLPNGIIPRAGNLNVVNGVPFIANNGLANANRANVITNTHTANMNYPHMPNNVLNTPIVSVLNDHAVLGNHNIGGAINNADMAALTNMANINGNTATFTLNNGGFTVTSGSPGSQGFGIQVLADALEVGGMVAVNGQIPIYGAVTLNGHLPTDGSAAVRYTCGGPAVDDRVLN